MPLKKGYGHATITFNIRALVASGHERTEAVVTALRFARASYFERYPAGALPLGLCYPKTNRLARHYTDTGIPIKNIPAHYSENPAPRKPKQRQTWNVICNNHTVYTGIQTKEEAEKIAFQYRNAPGAVVKVRAKTEFLENPIDDTQRKIARGSKLAKDFSGHTAKPLGKFAFPENPGVGVAIGNVLGISYSTKRDGVNENYYHAFRNVNSRPLLVTSHDGKQLYLIGGSYSFTDRGIVDKRRRD